MTVDTARVLNLPLDADTARGLQIGDRVRLCGPLYAARDAAHRRMAAALQMGGPLPVDLAGESIYYVGPTPARAGAIIGAAGPTTAARMDPFTPALLQAGLRLMVGKGGRSAAVQRAIVHAGAVYLIAVGGTGALLARHIERVEVIAYDDLGTEAIRRMWLRDFPAIVACDARGGDLFAEGREAWRESRFKADRPPLTDGALKREHDQSS